MPANEGAGTDHTTTYHRRGRAVEAMASAMLRRKGYAVVRSYSGLLEKCPAIAYTDGTAMSIDQDSGATMRRRTNAYTFDRKLYRIWSSGGSVWLDGGDDAADSLGHESITNCPTSSRKSHSNSTEISVMPENDPAGADCVEASLSHHACLGTPISHGKSGNTQNPDDLHSFEKGCVCDPEYSARLDPAVSDPALRDPMGNQDDKKGDSVSRNSCGTPPDLPRVCGEGPLFRVKARDYKLLDVPEHVPCFVCKGAWSHFIEKLTEERKKRPKDQQKARRICRSCYQAAKKRAQQAATMLPGIFDPARPSGVSSTDEEQESAVGKARLIGEYLSSQGWPEGILAHSGNGAHLLYRIDLANDDGSRDLVKRGLEALAAMFDDATSTVDTANHNAARIWKLYGTMSRKGDHTKERPHRRSRVLETPPSIQVVGRDLLERLATMLPATPPLEGSPSARPSPAGSNGQSIDLGAWLRDHGIGVAYRKPYQGGTLYVLDDCPFSVDHRDGAFAIQFPNGAVHAGCHHSSCGGGSQRWKELREKYESGKNERRRKKDRYQEQPESDDLSTGFRDQAREILKHGDPIAVMLAALARDHVGDETLARCLIYSMASQAVMNSEGLQGSLCKT